MKRFKERVATWNCRGGWIGRVCERKKRRLKPRVLWSLLTSYCCLLRVSCTDFFFFFFHLLFAEQIFGLQVVNLVKSLTSGGFCDMTLIFSPSKLRG